MDKCEEEIAAEACTVTTKFGDGGAHVSVESDDECGDCAMLEWDAFLLQARVGDSDGEIDGGEESEEEMGDMEWARRRMQYEDQPEEDVEPWRDKCDAY